MVNGILIFSNNKNVIAFECGDVGPARYQFLVKMKRSSRKHYPSCTYTTSKDITAIYHTSVENFRVQRNSKMEFWNPKIPSELECQTKNDT